MFWLRNKKINFNPIPIWRSDSISFGMLVLNLGIHSVFYFGLWFYVPVNGYGHVETVS